MRDKLTGLIRSANNITRKSLIRKNHRNAGQVRRTAVVEKGRAIVQLRVNFAEVRSDAVTEPFGSLTLNLNDSFGDTPKYFPTNDFANYLVRGQFKMFGDFHIFLIFFLYKMED